MKKKLVSLIMAVTLVAGLAVGCSTPGSKSSSGGSSSTGGEKVLRYAIKEEPPVIDPQLSNSMYTATMDFHLFDGLYRNNNGSVEPAGAESYDVSDDGLTYTFHLNKDAKWSDGETVKADDYATGFKRLVDPETASPGSYMASVVKNADEIMAGEKKVDELGIKVVDDYTFEVTLAYPAAYFPGMTSTCGFLPARADVVEKYGKEYATAPDKMLYNGPFVLKEWKQGEKLTLAKNENYWDADKVKLDSVEINIIPESSTQIGMFENGELDYVEVPAEMTSEYPDAQSYLSGAVEYLQVNTAASKYLDNKNFRLAMSAAIDREQYVKLYSGGNNKTTDRFVLPDVAGPDGSQTYDEAYPLDVFKTTADPDAAKEYMDKAMKELGVTNASDIKLKLNCADADSAKKAAEVLQSQLQDTLGIKVEVNQLAYKQLYENQDKNDFEMMFTGWVPDYSDPNAYLELFTSTSGYNHSAYNSKEYDAEMKKTQSTTDVKERYDALFAAEKIFCEDLPVIPLDLVQTKYLLNDKVKDFAPYFVGTSYNYVYADIAE